MDDSIFDGEFTWEVVRNSTSIVILPCEVGEYSIFIKDNLEGISQVSVDNGTREYLSKEILASPEGSVIYFSEKINNIYSNHIYIGFIFACFNKKLNDTLYDLYKGGCIPLTTYLTATSNKEMLSIINKFKQSNEQCK